MLASARPSRLTATPARISMATLVAPARRDSEKMKPVTATAPMKAPTGRK